MHARVRVLRTWDGKVTDTWTAKYKTNARAINEWLADDGQAIKTAFDRGTASIAEQVIDEIMLIYLPKAIPQQLGSDETERVPVYVLRPTEPPILNQSYVNLKSRRGYPLGELQPSLRWEAWPRGFDIVPGNEPGQAQQVRYDLRIFGAPGIVVYERRGIIEAEHRLEQPLELCQTYWWTVRARFMLNGAPRATEWTGAYNPWWWRRGSGALPLAAVTSVDSFYPIVETPSGDGKTCPDR
jgi:hypothetical protein